MNICSWNVRGLNSPNKQEDPSDFLVKHKVGIISLVETRIREKNVARIQNKIFYDWECIPNHRFSPKGRIWLCWRRMDYGVEVKEVSEQYSHCFIHQQASGLKFQMTFVYGLNEDCLRRPFMGISKVN